jgi:DNA-binding transcriptional ArsR family regulator
MAMAEVFKALGDPSRLDIVERLSARPATVGELADAYAMSMSAVLQHLRVLERSGLVRSTKTGRVRSCWVDPASLSGVEDWVHRHHRQVVARLDRLDAHLSAADGGHDA